jgi:hypothetical protein
LSQNSQRGVVGLFYWLHFVDKNTAFMRDTINSIRLSEYYCKIINQERKGLNKKRSAVFLSRKASFYWRKIFWRLFKIKRVGFLEDCPNGQNQCPDSSHKNLLFDACLDGSSDVNHKELPFATCPNGPVDANHREHPFVRMSGRKSEDCVWRSFSLQPSEH